MRRVALTLLTAALAGSAGADVIPPGHKGVSHRIYVEGTNRFPGHAFYIFPIRITGGAQRVVEGKPVDFYKFASPRLYAFAGTVPLKLDAAAFADPNVPRSEETFHVISTVPEAEKTRAIKTVYRVKAIEGKVIRLERGKDEISGPTVPSDDILVTVALVGMLGLGVALRRR